MTFLKVMLYKKGSVVRCSFVGGCCLLLCLLFSLCLCLSLSLSPSIVDFSLFMLFVALFFFCCYPSCFYIMKKGGKEGRPAMYII